MASFLLTQKNVTTENHIMRLQFPQQLMVSNTTEIALLSCYINYSWFNITSAFNNKTVSYYWPTDGSTNLVTFPEVFYIVSDIAGYIQAVMLQNGHYLVDDNGENVYYFNIQTNYTIYGNTATFTPLPSVLPTGWSNPAGLVLSVPNAVTPQLIFGNNNFGTLLGFETSTSYPNVPKTAITLINSPLKPDISPVTACLMTCNMINSPNYNQYGDVIQTFTPKGQFGSQIDITPPQLVWYPCIGGSYPHIQIGFYDQNLQPLGINDRAIVVTVKTRETKK